MPVPSEPPVLGDELPPVLDRRRTIRRSAASPANDAGGAAAVAAIAGVVLTRRTSAARPSSQDLVGTAGTTWS